MPRITRPVHFRLYAGDYGTMCGLIPGRNGKGSVRVKRKKKDKWGRDYEWKEVPCDVPYGRVNVRLERATCPVCLVRVARLAKRSLKSRLKLTKRTLLQEYRRHATEKTMGAMRRVVGDA